MKNKVFVILAFALLTVLNPASSFSKDASAQSDKIVIGVILPFSSAFEKIAIEQKNAIEIALSEIGGNVEAIYMDGRDDGPGAVAAFNELACMKNPPVAVISCASWASDALHPLAAKKGIFHIAIGSAIIQRTEPRHTVRFTIDAKQEERQLAEYLSQFNRIAIFNMDNGYGNNWAEILKTNFSKKIATSIAYDPTRKDFRPELSIIKEKIRMCWCFSAPTTQAESPDRRGKPA